MEIPPSDYLYPIDGVGIWVIAAVVRVLISAHRARGLLPVKKCRTDRRYWPSHRRSGVTGMRVMQAYRFALDLTPGQQRALLAHAGAARMAHNWALARVKAVLDQRAAERSYGLADDLLTPSQGWSLPALRKVWNAAKPEVAPWWRQV